MVIASVPLSVEEFLRLPEESPSLELYRGSVRQKVSPQAKHGRLQFRLAEAIARRCEPNGLALVFTELRARFGESVLVPDISIIRRARVNLTDAGEIANEQPVPDLAIEIASPGQAVPELVEKRLHEVAHGTEIALLVLPEDLRVFRFASGGVVASLQGAERVDLEFLLPGFELTVEAVFGLLRPDATAARE